MSWGDEAALLNGTRIFISENVAKGEARFDVENGIWYVHAYDWLLQVGRGRLPFETRMTLGMRELERDRRRHRC